VEVGSPSFADDDVFEGPGRKRGPRGAQVIDGHVVGAGGQAQARDAGVSAPSVAADVAAPPAWASRCCQEFLPYFLATSSETALARTNLIVARAMARVRMTAWRSARSFCAIAERSEASSVRAVTPAASTAEPAIWKGSWT